jgi:hypothetical protein
MTDDDEPNLVTSGRSKRVKLGGYVFSVEIYRFETDTDWVLEVVDQDGTSHVWDEKFASDKAAFDAAVASIEDQGAVAFIRGGNVIPFPGN